MENNIEKDVKYKEIKIAGKIIKVPIEVDDDYKNDYILEDELVLENTLNLSNITNNKDNKNE